MQLNKYLTNTVFSWLERETSLDGLSLFFFMGV